MRTPLVVRAVLLASCLFLSASATIISFNTSATVQSGTGCMFSVQEDIQLHFDSPTAQFNWYAGVPVSGFQASGSGAAPFTTQANGAATAIVFDSPKTDITLLITYLVRKGPLNSNTKQNTLRWNAVAQGWTEQVNNARATVILNTLTDSSDVTTQPASSVGVVGSSVRAPFILGSIAAGAGSSVSVVFPVINKCVSTPTWVWYVLGVIIFVVLVVVALCVWRLCCYKKKKAASEDDDPSFSGSVAVEMPMAINSAASPQPQTAQQSNGYMAQPTMAQPQVSSIGPGYESNMPMGVQSMGMHQSSVGMQPQPMGMNQSIGMQPQPMGMQPMGMQPQPMGMQPMGMQPMGMQPMGMQPQPMGMQPMGMQPMGMQPQPMGMQPMGMQPMGMQPMGMQPMGMQPMGGMQNGGMMSVDMPPPLNPSYQVAAYEPTAGEANMVTADDLMDEIFNDKT